jgi:beta-N-acetylhexosaminidase
LVLFFRKALLHLICPAIIGIAGKELSPEERALLRDLPPLGIILFSRNVSDPAQLADLISTIRAALPQALLMVDQEGGRVARLKPPHWRAHPPARAHETARAAWLTGALIGLDCRAAGFDLVAAPVLDVPTEGAHDVIGDRAFSQNPAAVAERGAAMAAGLLAAGLQPIGKHAPGHGRARADSHLTLPVLDDLAESDLVPFIANRGLPWLMTAHIRYISEDMQYPATQSAKIIQSILRAPAAIGFQGVLITDDLAMQALSGPPGERAARALSAGCDVALHCSGIFAESRQVLEAIPDASEACLARLAAGRALAAARFDPTLDSAALAAERAALFA